MTTKPTQAFLEVPTKEQFDALQSDFNLEKTSDRGVQIVRNPNFAVDRRNAGASVVFSGGDTDKYIVDRWRVIRHNTATALECKRINPFFGGLNLKFTTLGTYREYIYLRQLVWSNVLQYSGKTYTMLVEYETSETQLQYDWYIRARFNSNDAERPLVIDSADLTLPSGKNVLKVTFTVPDLFDGSGNPLYTLDAKNSLELAWRVIVPDGVAVTDAEVNVFKVNIISGSDQDYFIHSDVTSELVDAAAYFYYSPYITSNGFTSGNRLRAFNQPYSPMYKAVQGAIYDANGVQGRISAYDASGVRVDNVTPLSVTYEDNSVTIVTDDIYTGIGFYHEQDVEANI